jgi:hypothetical protein
MHMAELSYYGERQRQRQGSAARCAAQHSTAQHSTAQHSTAQHSTAQHSTAQRRCPLMCLAANGAVPRLARNRWRWDRGCSRSVPAAGRHLQAPGGAACVALAAQLAPRSLGAGLVGRLTPPLQRCSAGALWCCAFPMCGANQRQIRGDPLTLTQRLLLCRRCLPPADGGRGQGDHRL